MFKFPVLPKTTFIGDGDNPTEKLDGVIAILFTPYFIFDCMFIIIFIVYDKLNKDSMMGGLNYGKYKSLHDS